MLLKMYHLTRFYCLKSVAKDVSSREAKEVSCSVFKSFKASSFLGMHDIIRRYIDTLLAVSINRLS